MKSSPEEQRAQSDEEIVLNRQQLSKLIIAAREQGFLLAVLLLNRISQR